MKEETAFTFKIVDPYLVEIDTEKGYLHVKPVPVKEALRLRWQNRERRK